MSTTVHIPRDILARIDRRAKARRISRNRYIVEALERTLADESEWPPGFLDKLQQRGETTEIGSAVDEMMDAIRSGRRSKRKPPAL